MNFKTETPLIVSFNFPRPPSYRTFVDRFVKPPKTKTKEDKSDLLDPTMNTKEAKNPKENFKSHSQQPDQCNTEESQAINEEQLQKLMTDRKSTRLNSSHL